MKEGTDSVKIAMRFLSGCFGEDVVAERVLSRLGSATVRIGSMRDARWLPGT